MNEIGRFHTFSESSGGVVFDLHLFGQLTYRYPVAARTAMDGEHCLVLLRCDAVFNGGVFAEAEKLA